MNEDGDLTTVGVTGVATWRPNDGHELKATVAYREADSSRFVTLLPEANPAILNSITGGFNMALNPLSAAFAGQLRPDFNAAFTGDPPETGLFLSPPGGSTNLDGHNQLSLEATYNGEFADGRVEYTGGAFYYKEETGAPGGPNLANAND